MRDSKGHFVKGHKIGVGNKYRVGIPPWNKGLTKQNSKTKGGRPFGAKDKVKRDTSNYKGVIGEKSYMFGKHPTNWKGGTRKARNAVMDSIEYKFWRKSCMVRDNFTCQKYGIHGGKLVVHHINNYSDFPELRMDINNGITLSYKAHNEFHNKYTRKNNTLEQLQDFLKN